MILAYKHHSSFPLSARAFTVHREGAFEASRRARRHRPVPETVGILVRMATPVLRRRATELRRGLPRIVSRHPLGSIATSFLAGLIVGKTVLSITRH
jgi:hypothetical protein